MKKVMLLFMSLVVVVTLAGAVGYGSLAASPGGASSGEADYRSSGVGSSTLQTGSNVQSTGIWVSGLGEVEVTPDLAILRLGVEATASTVEAARSQAADAMGAVMTALLENNVVQEDIQTQWFSIYPVRKWIEAGEEVLIGYRVTNTVAVKVRDVANAGLIIDAAVNAGGDFIRAQGISFTIDDPSPYLTQARQEAMADAKAKAEQLASLAGVTLGMPTYISEDGGSIPTRDFGLRGMYEVAGVDTPISPGELQVRLTVQVAYAIE